MKLKYSMWLMLLVTATLSLSGQSTPDKKFASAQSRASVRPAHYATDFDWAMSQINGDNPGFGYRILEFSAETPKNLTAIKMLANYYDEIEDWKRAQKWYRRAGAMGDEPSILRLAMMYNTDINDPRDPVFSYLAFKSVESSQEESIRTGAQKSAKIVWEQMSEKEKQRSAQLQPTWKISDPVPGKRK